MEMKVDVNGESAHSALGMGLGLQLQAFYTTLRIHCEVEYLILTQKNIIQQ